MNVSQILNFASCTMAVNDEFYGNSSLLLCRLKDTED